MKVSIYILRIFNVTIPTRFIATAVIKWKMKIKYAMYCFKCFEYHFVPRDRRVIAIRI